MKRSEKARMFSVAAHSSNRPELRGIASLQPPAYYCCGVLKRLRGCRYPAVKQAERIFRGFFWCNSQELLKRFIRDAKATPAAHAVPPQPARTNPAADLFRTNAEYVSRRLGVV
jgi:hypothetical protein